MNTKPKSLNQIRWNKFKTIKRAYISFWIIIVTYVLALLAPLYINNKPYILKYNDEYYSPMFSNTFYSNQDFGLDLYGPAEYKKIQQHFQKEDKNNWVLMPPIPYYYDEIFVGTGHTNDGVLKWPSKRHILGTDTNGRDILTRIIYGYRLSMNYSLFILFPSLVFGIFMGACFGYLGGKFDLFGQRLLEILVAIPILYILIILDATVISNYFDKYYILIFFNMIFGWVTFSQPIRGMFFKEKTKDYVSASISMGASNLRVMIKHILPNTLTPIITLIPFVVMGYIIGLSSLDYLGFGLKPPAPSWGELLAQGRVNLLLYPYIFISIFTAFLFVLILIVFIGEGIREAFDPRVRSRLR